jgi:RNA polymerase sigma factor (sigma-70 family)
MQQDECIQLNDSPHAILYSRYAPSIFAYLYRETSSREDAEDLLLEVFLAVLERANFLTLGEKEQQAWLWKVAHNKVADHYRRFIRRPSVFLKQGEDLLYDHENLAPEQATLQQEEYAHLRVTLQALPKLQQEVLLLRFGHGLSCAEIASILQKNEAAVRMLLSRTLKHLRVIYKTQERGIL